MRPRKILDSILLGDNTAQCPVWIIAAPDGVGSNQTSLKAVRRKKGCGIFCLSRWE